MLLVVAPYPVVVGNVMLVATSAKWSIWRGQTIIKTTLFCESIVNIRARKVCFASIGAHWHARKTINAQQSVKQPVVKHALMQNAKDTAPIHVHHARQSVPGTWR
jgi:hypothetical protein